MHANATRDRIVCQPHTRQKDSTHSTWLPIKWLKSVDLLQLRSIDVVLAPAPKAFRNAGNLWYVLIWMHWQRTEKCSEKKANVAQCRNSLTYGNRKLSFHRVLSAKKKTQHTKSLSSSSSSDMKKCNDKICERSHCHCKSVRLITTAETRNPNGFIAFAHALSVAFFCSLHLSLVLVWLADIYFRPFRSYFLDHSLVIWKKPCNLTRFSFISFKHLANVLNIIQSVIDRSVFSAFWLSM